MIDDDTHDKLVKAYMSYFKARRDEQHQQPPLLCLMCEPNPKPEETKKRNTKNNTTTRNKRDGNVGNGAKRRARAKTKAYAFALNSCAGSDAQAAAPSAASLGATGHR